jgi:hypothetical protein
MSLPARKIAAAADKVGEILGFRPDLSHRLDKYTEDIAVSSDRFRRQLEYAPDFGLMAGWNEAVAEMRHSHTL